MGVKSKKKFLENFSENLSIYIIMKRIIKLTESDLRRIVRRTINEMEDDEKCEGLCYLLHNGECIPISEFKDDIFTKIKKWYDDKKLTEDWFFELIETDPDVKEFYENTKWGGDSWNHNDEMVFFYELALSYCKGKMKEYLETELSHPCYETKPKPEKILF